MVEKNFQPSLDIQNFGENTNSSANRTRQPKSKFNMEDSSSVAQKIVSWQMRSTSTPAVQSLPGATKKAEAFLIQPIDEHEMNVLFSHNAEIYCYNKCAATQKWKKGIMKVVAESNDPIMVRLSMKINEETHLDELLTVQMQFDSISKTTVKWSGEDFSKGEMRAVDSTIRFKTSNIFEKFSNVLLNTQKQMKKQLECSKCCIHITNFVFIVI